MVDGKNFSLCLNEFQNNVATSWKDMQTEKDFYDVTLACEDKQIKSHKLILSSFSPVLRNILKLSQNPHPLIYLRKVKYRHLASLSTRPIIKTNYHIVL